MSWSYRRNLYPCPARHIGKTAKSLIPHLPHRQYQGAYLYADSSALNEVCHAVYMVAVTVGYQDIIQLPHSTVLQEWLYPVLPYLLYIAASSVNQIGPASRALDEYPVSLPHIQYRHRQSSCFSEPECQYENSGGKGKQWYDSYPARSFHSGGFLFFFPAQPPKEYQGCRQQDIVSRDLPQPGLSCNHTRPGYAHANLTAFLIKPENCLADLKPKDGYGNACRVRRASQQAQEQHGRHQGDYEQVQE